MNIAQLAFVEAQNRALVRLLLGNAVMAPSLAMFAGEAMDADQRLQLATLAMNTQIDVIYVAYDVDEKGDPAIADITVFLPRDTGFTAGAAATCRSRRTESVRSWYRPPREGISRYCPGRSCRCRRSRRGRSGVVNAPLIVSLRS